MKALKPCHTYLEFPDVPQFPDTAILIKPRVAQTPGALPGPGTHSENVGSARGAEQNQRDSFLCCFQGPKENKRLNSTLEGKTDH